MCVPGVQAYAGSGSRTSAAMANSTAAPTHFDVRFVGLEPELAALPADGLPEVGQLLLHRALDAGAGVVQVLADVVPRNAVPELLPSIRRPPGAAGSVLAGPACAAAGRLEHRDHRPRASRSAAEQQRGRCTDDYPEQRRREQVELLLTRVRLSLRAAAGSAASLPRARAWPCCCTHRSVPPELSR